jgi:FADH2 O2-dependent halogenase
MIEIQADVAVIGAGFGGTLTALILERIGLRPVVIERGVHPRFALGESSTPLADLVLESLARKYDLPRVLPLANYGTWQRAYPDLVCGLKRGFSYFSHEPGRPFVPRADHANELLVAASLGPDDADTHWLRSEFDHFLVQEIQRTGIPYLDGTELTDLSSPAGWELVGRRGDEPIRIRAPFVIDASGNGGFLTSRLKIPSLVEELGTNSRAIYAHFRGVRSWRELLVAEGAHVEDHPFPCDDAALHHVFPGGWMYVLRFNNGVTSAGFSLDTRQFPLDPALTPEEEWAQLLRRLPSVAAQFAEATIITDGGKLRRTGRLQRFAAPAAGPNWALLPTAAGILDALHSSGNAHTLYGIERLTGILERSWNRPELAEALQGYSEAVETEIRLLDQIVHGCYAGFRQFELMAQFSMFYFAGATVAEQRRRLGLRTAEEAFLGAHDPAFRAAVGEVHRRILQDDLGFGAAADPLASFAECVRQQLAPFNIVGLCDPRKHNMYEFCPGL